MTKVRSVRVLSAAKVNGVLYGILGLLFAPVFLLGPGLAAVGGGERRGFGTAIVFAVFLPFSYAILGFIGGALLAFIYNAISHAIGGIEIELLAPPPAIANSSATAVPAPPEIEPEPQAPPVVPNPSEPE